MTASLILTDTMLYSAKLFLPPAAIVLGLFFVAVFNSYSWIKDETKNNRLEKILFVCAINTIGAAVAAVFFYYEEIKQALLEFAAEVSESMTAAMGFFVDHALHICVILFFAFLIYSLLSNDKRLLRKIWKIISLKLSSRADRVKQEEREGVVEGEGDDVPIADDEGRIEKIVQTGGDDT